MSELGYLINRTSSRYIVIAQEYAAICMETRTRRKPQPKNMPPEKRKDYVGELIEYQTCHTAAAVALRLIERWTIHKISTAKNYGNDLDPNDTWVWFSRPQLKEYEFMDAFSWNEIDKGFDFLVERGYISRRNNPYFGGDRTYQYRFNTKNVQAAIDALPPFPDISEWRDQHFKSRRSRVEDDQEDHVSILKDDTSTLQDDASKLEDGSSNIETTLPQAYTQEPPQEPSQEKDRRSGDLPSPAAVSFSGDENKGSKPDITPFMPTDQGLKRDAKQSRRNDQERQDTAQANPDARGIPDSILGKSILKLIGNSSMTNAQMDLLETPVIVFDGEKDIEVVPSALYKDDPLYAAWIEGPVYKQFYNSRGRNSKTNEMKSIPTGNFVRAVTQPKPSTRDSRANTGTRGFALSKFYQWCASQESDVRTSHAEAISTSLGIFD